MYLHLDRMSRNIERIMAPLPKGTRTCLVIKADAYGLGVVPVARIMEKQADFFAVATAEEALELRENGITKPILILGYADPAFYEKLVAEKVRLTVYQETQAEELSWTGARLGTEALIHIKVDTGMNRIGFEPTPEDADRVAVLKGLPYLKIEGLFSHFARADETDPEPARRQYTRFRSMKAMLAERGVVPDICHIANSAASMIFPEASEDMVRLGIAIYGLHPSDIPYPIPLEPVAELKSQVVMVKTVYPGEEIGYGGRYSPEEPRRIATVCVGYADGYTRRLSQIGRVLIHGKSAPIRGNICMDQMMVDVTEIPDVRCGDTVTLIGRDGDEEITLEELAELSGILNYEFQCGLSRRRVPRVIVRSDNNKQ